MAKRAKIAAKQYSEYAREHALERKDWPIGKDPFTADVIYDDGYPLVGIYDANGELVLIMPLEDFVRARNE